MAIIKKFAPFQNLSNFQVFINDTNSNSDYFRITEFNETFTGGKNGFLIEGSEFLKETTEVKIEILDVVGNPIFYEPGDGIPEYYEGNSKLVSVHVYDDTPIGTGKITILGELKNYVDENGAVVPVPDEWKGIYNVKWERTFQVNKNLNNETIVRFYKRPVVSISELVKPILTKTINNATDTGNVNGFPLQPASGQKLSEWRAGTNYLLQRTSGTWDIDVDENTISIGALNYSPTIIEVLNDTDVIVDTPYTDSSGNVSAFSNQSFSVTYQDIENETVGETSITGSFAKIDISQLKTFVGDVARVKIFRKSRNAVGDFQFVQEAKLESQELLRDITSSGNTEVFYGKLTNNTLSTYWETSSIQHPVTIDSTKLSRAAHIDYDTSVGGVQQLITSESISLSSDVEYTLNFKTLLSGSLSDSNKSIRAFFSSSNFTQDFLTISGSAIYRAKQDVTKNIISQNTGNAKLVFEVKGDDWFISNISLRNAQDTSFSPDEFTIIQDIPRKTAAETFDFRFEFYDVNNNFIPVNVTATKEFDGGNDFPTSGKLFTFESDRNAFRFSSGSIGNPYNQTIQFKTSKQNLTGSVTYASSAFDVDGNYLSPSNYSQYPGKLTNITTAGALVTLSNFTGSYSGVGVAPYVGSVVYTASLENFEEFETVYRLEDGDNAPQLIVTSNTNQFIYEPTTLSPKPSGQSVTIRAQRKNLASLITPIEVNSGSNTPELTFVGTTNGIDTYTISATEFSSSFADNDFDEVTYSFTGSDVFGNNQSDEITISKVINFDGVSIVLSNESTSFPCNSTGEVTNGFVASSGSVQMFIGGNQIQHNDGLTTRNRFDIVSISGAGVTPTSTSPTNANYSISAFETSKDSGSLTLTIDYKAGDNSTTQSFQKVVSYTKSKKAVPTVLTKVSPSTQTINSSSVGFETPQTMEVVVQEGGDEYTYSQNLSSNSTFRINSLGYTAGSASFDDEIITLFTDSVGDGSGTFITSGLIGSASLDYKNSEGTQVNNKTVRFDLSVSKIGVDGVNGASGSDAKIVSLTSTAYAIKYDGDGNLAPSGQTFTLSGSARNFTSPEFQFFEDGTQIYPSSAGTYSSTSEIVVPTDAGTLPAGGQTSLYEVRVIENGSYTGVFDNIDVFGVQSGSDAFTTFLTNEAHVYAADSNGTVTSTLSDGAFETRFFRGAQQYHYDGSSPYDTNSYRIANVTKTGITTTDTTIGSGTSAQRKFTPTAINAQNGSITLDLIDNNTGQSFEKTYTFSISKKGVPNVLISATPQSQNVSANSSGTQTGTLSNVTISALEGTTSRFTSMTVSSVSGINVTTGTTYVSGNTLTLSGRTLSAAEASITLTVTHTDGEGNSGQTQTIVVRVTKSSDGEKGDKGDQGDPGTNGVTPTSIKIDTITNQDGSPGSTTSPTISNAYYGIWNTSGTALSAAARDWDTIGYLGLGANLVSSNNFSTNMRDYIRDVAEVGDDVVIYIDADNFGQYSLAAKTLAGSSGDTVIQLSHISSNGQHTGGAFTSANGKYIGFGRQLVGPGVVFRGTYNSTKTYYYTETRRDVVEDSNGDYKLAANTAKSGLATWGNPTTSTDWASFGAQFSSVATDILFADDVFARYTINIGSDGSNPVIALNSDEPGGHANPYISIGAASYGGNGVWLGFNGGTAKASFVNSTTSYMKWTGTALEIKGDVTATSGDFDGAITIAGGSMKIGKDVNSTNDGIFINSNNYWYSNGNFKVGNASGNMEFDGTDLIVTGEIQATSGRLRSVTIGEGSNLLSLSDGGISGSGIFSLSNTGILTADGASVSGEIEASGGSIGGWQIIGDVLQSSNGDVRLDPTIDETIKISDAGATKVILSSGTQTLPITPTTKNFYIPKPNFSSRSITVLDDNFGTDTSNITSTVTIASGEEGGYTVNLGNSFWSGLTDVLDVCSAVGSLTAGECGASPLYPNVRVNYVLQVYLGSTLIDSVTMTQANSFNDNDMDNVIPSSVTFNLLTAGTYTLKMVRSYTVKYLNAGTVTLPATSHSGTLGPFTATVNTTYTEISKEGFVSAYSLYDYLRITTNVSTTSLVYATATGQDYNEVATWLGDTKMYGDLQLYAFTSPSGFYTGNGSIQAAGNITAFASDDRLKIRLGNIENPLTKIMSLNGFKFRFNDFAKEHGAQFEDIDYVGVSAQEIEKVLPEVIKPAPFDTEKNKNGEKISKSGLNFKTVQYEKIVPLLIEGIKELTNKVETLENEIFKLKGK